MHDPMVVAHEIHLPIPVRARWRDARPGQPRWTLGRHRRTNEENLGEPVYPWWRPNGWTPRLAGRAFGLYQFLTVWHVEPKGRDSGEVCKHIERWQDDAGKWHSRPLKAWKWHVHHWQVQFHLGQKWQRRLFQRCAWCNGRSTKTAPVNCSAQWDGPGPKHFWSSAPDLYHSGCQSAQQVLRSCLCEVPLVPERWKPCERCGKFYGGEAGHIGLRQAVAISGMPQPGQMWTWPRSVNCHEIERRLEAEPLRSAKRDRALLLAKGEARGRAAADDLVAAAVADRAALEAELAAERARADRMAAWLHRWVLGYGDGDGPPTERDALDLLADHHAARAETGR